MSNDVTLPVDLNESVVETLRRRNVSPIDHFAAVAAGRSPCLLCHGATQISELVYHLHSGKAMGFDMLQKLRKDEMGPCPECYARGYVYSAPDRQDRAAALLINNMPEQAPSSGPVVQRFHRAGTIEEAYRLDKEMKEALGDDGVDSIEGEYTISLDEDEAMLDAIEAEREEIDNEVFWDQPDIDGDIEPTN